MIKVKYDYYNTYWPPTPRSLYGFPSDYCVVDVETTGLSPKNCEMIEIAALKIRDNKVIDSFSSLIQPSCALPEIITKITGITDDDLIGAETIETVLPKFLEFVNTDAIVGHNITFDINFIRAACDQLYGKSFYNDYINTLRISKNIVHTVKNHRLETLAEYFDIKPDEAHRALADCYTTYELFKKLYDFSFVYENNFIDSIKEDAAFKDTIVLFRGAIGLYSYDTWEKVCEKLGATATEFFIKDYSKIKYIILGTIIFNHYKRNIYFRDENIVKNLVAENNAVVMSEEQFVRMLGGVCPEHRKKFYLYDENAHVSIKEMHTDVEEFDKSHPLYGKTCVFTGTLDKMDRKEAMQHVLDLGGNVGNSITKKTDFLILGCNDFCLSIKNGKSSKQKKAEEYILKGFDIKIIDEQLFYSMLEDI